MSSILIAIDAESIFWGDLYVNVRFAYFNRRLGQKYFLGSHTEMYLGNFRDFYVCTWVVSKKMMPVLSGIYKFFNF